MPRFTTGRSSSPDHITFHSRRKPSTPIEIPKRRRPIVSPLISPLDQPKSPDLIFDMSPISPISPSPFNHTIPLSTSNKMSNHGPFIYNVPVYIPSCHSNTATRFSTSSRQRVMPSSTAAPISAAHRNAWRTQTTHAENVNDSEDSNSQSERDDLSQTPLTTKITGFIPSVEQQPPIVDYPSKPVGRLSPPPRQESYSSSPWILPGTGNVEDDIAYSQIDPSVFEFKRHLLRRIENRDASQFMSFHSCL
ncbi:hypothetical protein BYT27DRAFT_6880806 [Phlegmacium glaucopus]|nr:hypothetical protein BYT27DRAFT_6880806 [Phlegmacium glaucopus]